MKNPRARYPRPVLLALVAALVGYAFIWFSAQTKLIYTDEVPFAFDMRTLAGGDWAQLTIPHPPLYVWLGSLAIRLWGYDLFALRVVGGLSFVATLFLIPLVCSALIDDERRATRASLIALVIYALHPLALQGSLLLDIDNTIFTPALFIFIIALARTESSFALTRIFAVAAAFALLLWTKLLPTPLIIIAAVLFVYALRRKFFISTMAGIALGAFFFALTFGVFAMLVNFPLTTFAATFQRTESPLVGGISRLITRGVQGGGILVVWLGIPFALIYLWLVACRLLEFIRTRQANTRDILIVATLGGFALYTLGNELPMGFPRYHYPLFALMVVLVSDYFAGFEFANARERNILIALGIASAIYFAFVIPDPLLPQYDLTFQTNDLMQRLVFGLRLELIAFVVPFGLLWLVLGLALRQRARAFLFASVAFCGAAWSVLTVAQARADYATIYEYGRVGGTEAGALVKAKTTANDTIIAPMEIIFEADRSGEFDLFYACPTCVARTLLSKFATQPPAAFVLTMKEDGRYTQVTRDPLVVAELERCYSDRATIGSYLMYFRSVECH